MNEALSPCRIQRRKQMRGKINAQIFFSIVCLIVIMNYGYGYCQIVEKTSECELQNFEKAVAFACDEVVFASKVKVIKNSNN